MKKAISFLLALVMALSLLPAAVWADNKAGGDTSGGNAGGESNALQVGGCTVYYATSVSNEGVVSCNANVNNTAKLGENGEISAFKVAGAVANEKYYIVVMWGENETEPTITLRQRESVIDGEKKSNKTVFELTVPEVGTQEDTVVDFDLCVNSSLGSPFGVIFAKKNDNPDQGGGGGQENFITKYSVTDEGGYVIEEVSLPTNDRPTIELNPGWTDAKGEFARIGLTPSVVSTLSSGSKEVLLYNSWGVRLRLSPDTLADMASKQSQNGNLVWFNTDYVNMDKENGAAYAFRSFVKIDDTEYTDKPYTLIIDRETAMGENGEPYTGYALYRPNADNNALVFQDAGVNTDKDTWVDEENSEHSVTIFSFTVYRGGMFVLIPEGYDVSDNWWFWDGERPAWEPGKGSTPEKALGWLQRLYNNGYTFPEFGKDFTLNFPDGLYSKADHPDDWDYDCVADTSTGIISIVVNHKNADRWRKVVEDMGRDYLGDGVYFNYYSGNGAWGKDFTYGTEFYNDFPLEDVDSVSADRLFENGGTELSTDYYPSNAQHLADINRNGKYVTVSAKEGTRCYSYAIAMDNNDNVKSGAAAVRYALQINVTVEESFAYTVVVDNGKKIEANRIHVKDVHTDWEATNIIEDGTLIMQTKSGKVLNSDDLEDGKELAGTNNGQIAILNVDSIYPGYTLRWESYDDRGDSSDIPLRKVDGDVQTVTLFWEKDGADTIVEYLNVEYTNGDGWMSLLGEKDNVPSKPLTVDSVLPGNTKAKLAESGINVAYNEETGYFRTTIDASKLNSETIRALKEGIQIASPYEGATHFRCAYIGGSENPNWHGATRRNDVWNNLKSWEGAFSVEEDGAEIFLPFVYWKTMPVQELTVYYTDNQLYRGIVVQWLNDDGQVIGYSYVYGRNGDLATALPTKMVRSAPTEEVEVPTLVGDVGEFYCSTNPQSGNEHVKFYRFNVKNEGEIGESVTIYLPYEYFNMTKEQGLALASQGIKPTVTHYMDDACTTTKPIIDSAYTEYGVMIVTDSFSPYVIDCSATGDDDTTPPRYYYSSGSGSSDSTITSGADQTKQAGDIVKVTVKSSAKVQTVYVDGVALSAGDYIISGGTVKLQGTYTVKLAQGSHTLRIAYSDGSAVSTTFTLKGTTAPKTGDAGIAVYAVMALGGCTGAAALAFRRKRED